MKNLVTLTALSAALLSAPAAIADDGQTLLIKDFVGTVSITTGSEFSVSGKKGDITEIKDGGLIIDGNEVIDNSSCKTVNGNIDINIGKKSWLKRIGGYKNLKDYPKLDITVPAGAHLEIIDSVIFGTGEDFGSVDAHMKSCGALEIGTVDGPLVLNLSGSGDFSALDVGTANVRISGSGDAELGDMKTAVLRVSGSGDISGGNIIGASKITATGSGDIELESITGDLVYEGRGSSEFETDRVDGRISITVSGSGDVEIDQGEAPSFLVTSRGSSNVEYGGTAGDVTIAASGSGSVKIKDATGERAVKSSGSSSVKIGGVRYDD